MGETKEHWVLGDVLRIDYRVREFVSDKLEARNAKGPSQPDHVLVVNEQSP